MEKILTSVICTLTGVVFFLYGNDPVMLQWLITVLVLVVFDLLLGALNAAMEKTFTRRLLLEGVRRKLGELLLIAVAHFIDVTNMLQGTVDLQQAATGFIIAYEAISVLDKIKIGGTPIPKIVTDYIGKALGKFDGSDQQSNEK
jgi:toxin secretion/phage lysis holin